MTTRSPTESLLAVRFEGVGDDGTKSEGIAFYTGLPSQVLPSDYEWWPALAEEPGGVRASVNPFTGDWSVGSVDFALEASDRVAALLMGDQRDPAYELDGAITKTATSATVSASGISSGDVIWIADEAILVGSASGTSLSSLTRGYWGTLAQSHEDEEEVHDQIPYWRSRRVDLLEVDTVSGTVTTRWRGLVEDIRMEGARITVRCEELLGVLAKAEVNNQGAEVDPGYSRWVINRLSEATSGFRPRSIRPDIADGKSLLLQVDTALIPFNFEDDNGDGFGFAYLIPGQFGLAVEDILLLGSQPPNGADSPLGEGLEVEVIYELLGWIRQQGTGANASGYTPVPTGALKPFHPLSVALTLLSSTGRGDNGDYDVLGAAWSVGVDYIDFTRWVDEIEVYPDLVIDRLILGWDGESVNPFDVARRVMRPFGYYIGISDDGLLYPARLRMVTEADIDTAANTLGLYPDGPLTLDRGLSLSTSAVRARVGDLPWQEGSLVTVRNPRASRRAANLVDERVHEIDLSIFDPQRIKTNNRIDEIVSPFVGLLGLGLDSAPVLRGRTADYQQVSTMTDLDLGSYVRVSDLGLAEGETWLVLPDGSRVAIDDTSARWIGILIERDWDTRTHTYTVGVLLLNWRGGLAIKERAPAAIVGSGSTTTVIELDDTLAYGDSPGDAFWTAADGGGEGDVVRITDANGVDLGYGGREVASATATALTLSSALTTAPSAGDVVRLVQSGSFLNDKYSATSRPYTYLAPSAGESIDDANTDEGPDIYGTALFGGSGGAELDGLSLVPIDDDAVESAAAGSAEPLDSWLEYTLRDNVSEIIQRGHQVSWAPLTGNAGSYSTDDGHRPYCSVDYTSVLYVPWICEPGLAEVDLGIIARVSSESDVAGDVSNASVSLLFEVDSRNATATLESTDGDTPEFQPTTLTLDFSGRPFARRQIQNLRLFLQSDTDTLDGDDVVRSDASYGAFTIESTSGTPYADPATTATHPNADDLSLQCTEDGNGSLYDHLRSLDSRTMVVDGDGASSSSSLTTRWLPYAQIRSIEIQQRFLDDSYPSDESMRPAQPVFAETCVSHVTRERRHYQRARPVWVGPQGIRPYDPESNPEGWPEGYTQRHIVLNATDSGTDPTLLDAGVWFDTPNPNVTILMNVIPVRTLDFNTLLRSGPGTPLADPITVAQWDVWADVEQLEDGDADWTGATSLGSTSTAKAQQSLIHWGAYASAEYPTLLGHALRSSAGWPYREGQIYRREGLLVQTLKAEVPITYDPTTNRPARVTVSAEHLSTDWAYGGNRDTDYLDLIVVGASIWEEPS